MGKKMIVVVLALCFVAGATGFSENANARGTRAAGLVGAWYGETNLTNCKGAVLMKTLDRSWTKADGRGENWSAKWEGFVVAPTTADITFYAETSESVVVEIGDKKIIKLENEQKEQSTTLSMVKNKEYPIRVTYFQDGGYDGYLRVKWSLAGQGKSSIPSANLCHSAEQANRLGWQEAINSGIKDFLTIPVKNVIVYKEAGHFCGWPANNGVWIWGNEILVGFHLGYYKAKTNDHSIARDRPSRSVLARSTDGGETWTMEDPDNFVGDGKETVPCPGNINFANPDFAMRVGGNRFFISYDRGHKWQGPYMLPDFGGKKLTSRTDYIVNGPRDCLIFVSAKEPKVEAGLRDRAFCIQTADGGKTFKFLSWMTYNLKVRSVMPSTVRISKSHLVSAMRRRHDIRREGLPNIRKDWIDVYESLDNGKSWKFLSKVADTDRGEKNGNPPSMVRLRNGRLCVTYGYRSKPYGIRAKLSDDNGKTWGKEIHLRDDARTWDMGYTRTVQRLDGKLVTMYYFTTRENPPQHIAATIWNPDLVGKNSGNNKQIGQGISEQ